MQSHDPNNFFACNCGFGVADVETSMPDQPMNAASNDPIGPMPNHPMDLMPDHLMNDTEWSDLIDRIEDHDVVPVLGRALSRVPGPDGVPTKLYDDLLRQKIMELNSGGGPPNASITSYEELFAAQQALGEADIDFHKGLARQIGRYQTLSKPFEDLAAISDFRLFLSTAPDNALSEVLERSRGSVDTRTFDGTALVDLPRNFRTNPRTCVYKLLGGVETSPNWGLVGDDLLRMLFALCDTRTKPTELLRYVEDKHILAIGCQVPDWFGRFFVHWMRSGPLRKSRASQHLVDDDSDIDALFRKYIGQFGKKAVVVGSQPVEFAAELRRRWTDRQKIRKRPPPSATPNGDSRPGTSESLEGKVFISYVGSDRPWAKEIADHLTNKSVDVFYDKDSIPDGAHWPSFLDKALDKCMAFFILISQEAMQRDESVAFSEWRSIVKRSNQRLNRNEFVYPILINDGTIESVPADIELAQFQARTMKEITDLDALAENLCKRQRALRRPVH
jgi:hypothetical protein